MYIVPTADGMFYSSFQIDLYYPLFMTVKFLFYFGWLRVAETLYNPFGEDDDDFEINELLNRHFRVAMAIVHDDEPPPELLRDMFWNLPDAVLVSLYTIIAGLINKTYIGIFCYLTFLDTRITFATFYLLRMGFRGSLGYMDNGPPPFSIVMRGKNIRKKTVLIFSY